MNAWKIGGSKVVRSEVKNNREMPEYMASHGLTAFQVTTPRKVNFSQESVDAIVLNSQSNGITLGFHAENYTNVISGNKTFWEQIQKHWGNTIMYSKAFNAPTVIHCGGNYWKDREKQLYTVVDRISRIIEETEAKPELLYLEVMGGINQFGASLMDLLDLSKVLKTRVCVDWAHIYAVQQSNFTPELVNRALRLLEQTDWKYEQWFHFSGMIYDKDGEYQHIDLENSQFPYKMVLDQIKASDLAGVIITESGYENAHDSKLIRDYLAQ